MSIESLEIPPILIPTNELIEANSVQYKEFGARESTKTVHKKANTEFVGHQLSSLSIMDEESSEDEATGTKCQLESSPLISKSFFDRSNDGSSQETSALLEAEREKARKVELTRLHQSAQNMQSHTSVLSKFIPSEESSFKPKNKVRWINQVKFQLPSQNQHELAAKALSFSENINGSYSVHSESEADYKSEMSEILDRESDFEDLVQGPRTTSASTVSSVGLTTMISWVNYSGWGWKQSKTLGVTAWSRRYFVLWNSSLLFYFKVMPFILYFFLNIFLHCCVSLLFISVRTHTKSLISSIPCFFIKISALFFLSTNLQSEEECESFFAVMSREGTRKYLTGDSSAPSTNYGKIMSSTLKKQKRIHLREISDVRVARSRGMPCPGLFMKDL